jgi:hypothetical protein
LILGYICKATLIFCFVKCICMVGSMRMRGVKKLNCQPTFSVPFFSRVYLTLFYIVLKIK